jgi:hypothetical protein
MAIKSKLYLASSKSKTSLKTSIPHTFVELCGITDKHELEWQHVRIDGECILQVKVVKEKGKES